MKCNVVAVHASSDEEKRGQAPAPLRNFCTMSTKSTGLAGSRQGFEITQRRVCTRFLRDVVAHTGAVSGPF